MRYLAPIAFVTVFLLSLSSFASADHFGKIILGNENANEDFDNLQNRIEDEFSDKITDDLFDYFEDGKAELVFIFEEEVSKEFFDVVSEDKLTDFVEGSDLIAAVVSEEELYNILLENDELISVEPQREVRPLLQDSVQITYADDAWQIPIGEGFADGTGQTICVIDTGVNFSHSDLGPKNALGGLTNVDCSGFGCVFNDRLSPFDDGHGTHVAGIAAAASGIDGIGKGAKIIGIRIMDDSGNTFGTKIMRGIDWCNNNREIYNISVISISFGTFDLYTDYCDSQQTGFGSRITNAFNNGIAVAAATGNDDSTAGIVAPACIQKAIPVSGIWKTGSWAPYANYNWMVKLFAVSGRGGNGLTEINSTSIYGGYETRFGTSMSTPEVAGALAILRQVLDETNQQMTPHEMEDLLHSTGFDVTNLPSQYQVINISNAVETILPSDNEPPVVTLITNDSFMMESISYETDGDGNVIGGPWFEDFAFECEATDNAGLSDVKFYLWDESDNLFYEETKPASGLQANVVFNVSTENFVLNYDENGIVNETAAGEYHWNCEATDTSNNVAMALEDYYLTLNFLILILIGNECPADIAPLGEPDGKVNFKDLELLLNNWRENQVDPEADINEDGVVESEDLIYVLDNWGACENERKTIPPVRRIVKTTESILSGKYLEEALEAIKRFYNL